MKAFYSVSEAAELIGVSRPTVQYWIKQNKLKATKVGRTWVILPAQIKQAKAWPKDARGRKKGVK